MSYAPGRVHDSAKTPPLPTASLPFCNFHLQEIQLVKLTYNK